MCPLSGMVSVRGRTAMQTYGDLFQIEVMFSTECLEFLKIIPLADISKQSCSKLKYAVYIHIHVSNMCEQLWILKKRCQAECTNLTEKNPKPFMLDSLNFKALLLVLFNKTVYLSLWEVKEASVTLPGNLLLLHTGKLQHFQAANPALLPYC